MNLPEEIRVELAERSYDILVAPGSLGGTKNPDVERFSQFVKNKNVLLVSDSNTERLFGSRILTLLRDLGAKSAELFSFPVGEGSKTFQTAEAICRAAFQAHLDRSGVIVALGGGVVGDLAGFAAAIYMRGIDFIQLPTSLLAMIDSSIGGKTGANLPEGKNLIGAFHQPQFVLMDPELLKSLPPEQLRSGFAELIKHAILFDSELFGFLFEHSEDLLSLRDFPLLTRLIARSCRLKAVVVAQDEKESGKRALLNFGHSFGHALETLQNFRGFTHGEAVGYGMAVAAALSRNLGRLEDGEAEKIRQLLLRYHLPVTCHDFEPETIAAAMEGDKKNTGGKKRLVLPLAIGHCDIFSDVPEAELIRAIGDCRD